MSRRMKLSLFGGVVVVLIGAIVALSAAKKGGKPVEVRIDKVGTRDLVAAVTASGTIRPKTSVDVSPDIQGRIVKIGVREGDMVKKGQFLMQIDPAQYEAAVARAKALLSASQGDLIRARATRDNAKRIADRNNEMQKSNANLVSTETVEQSQTNYEVAVANYNSAVAQVDQAQAGLKDAESALSKTTLVSPIDGRVVRMDKEVGEIAVPGTFSAEVGLLATIADLSVILAKVQVDETDVVRLHLGDSVKVTIDAFPDTSFVGRVTKISNSAQLASTSTASGSNDPSGGLRRRGHPGQSAGRRAARPELHRADGDRYPQGGAQHPDHRPDRPGQHAGAERVGQARHHSRPSRVPRRKRRACSWSPTASPTSGRSRSASRATSTSRSSRDSSRGRRS